MTELSEWWDAANPAWNRHTFQIRSRLTSDSKTMTDWRCATCNVEIKQHPSWGYHLLQEHIETKEHMEKIAMHLLAL
jgi:hypothetical protein